MDIVRNIFACAALAASSGAAAAESGFYFGLMGGQAEYDFAPSPLYPVLTATPGPIPRLPPIFEPYPGPIGAVTAVAVASAITWPESADNEATA